MEKIKMIWVFSGPNAEDLAKEKLIYLEGLGERNVLDFYAGTEYISHISWLTYLIVTEESRANFLVKLKPTRIENFED